MKYTTTDLLFGIQIRAFAMELRNVQRQKDLAELKAAEPLDLLPQVAYTPAEQAARAKLDAEIEAHRLAVAAFNSDWNNQNPVDRFVAEAVEEIERITALAIPDR